MVELPQGLFVMRSRETTSVSCMHFTHFTANFLSQKYDMAYFTVWRKASVTLKSLEKKTKEILKYVQILLYLSTPGFCSDYQQIPIPIYILSATFT